MAIEYRGEKFEGYNKPKRFFSGIVNSDVSFNLGISSHNF